MTHSFIRFLALLFSSFLGLRAVSLLLVVVDANDIGVDFR
jgi:hypothetical protein